MDVAGLADAILGAIVAGVLSYVITLRWIGSIYRAIRDAEDQEKKLVLRKLYLAPDMNKYHRVEVPRFGGVWSVIAIAFGLYVLEAYHVYLKGETYELAEIFAVSSLLLLGAFVGLVDDIMGWKVGVPIRYRLIASFVMALPLSVVQAGRSVMILPLIGRVDLGIYYSLLVVPIGVMGASNAFNMLAGFNGLEAGMAAIILASYTAYALLHGKILAAKISIIALGGVLAFLLLNKYPAKTFPGNAFTYAIGALLAAIVIVGNFEKFGVAIFLLYFLELALFLRGLRDGIYKENFGIPRADGSLDPPYEKVYGVTHLAIVLLKRLRGRATEKGVVALILSAQALISLVVLLLSTIIA